MKSWVGLFGWPGVDGGHLSAAGWAHDRKSFLARDRRSTTVSHNKPWLQGSVLQPSSIWRLTTPWMYFLRLSLSSAILSDSFKVSPVHVLMLSIQAGCAWSSSPACTCHCSLHYLFLPWFPHGGGGVVLPKKVDQSSPKFFRGCYPLRPPIMPNFIEIGQTSLETGVGRKNYFHTQIDTWHLDRLSRALQHARGTTKNKPDWSTDGLSYMGLNTGMQSHKDTWPTLLSWKTVLFMIWNDLQQEFTDMKAIMYHFTTDFDRVLL